MESGENVGGVLQVSEKGGGFLRLPGNNLLSRPKDLSVPRNLIERLSLREGVYVEGIAKPVHDGRGRAERIQLAGVNQVNGMAPQDYARVPDFSELISIDPTERLELSKGSDNMSMRVLDLISPIGKGQRGLIVAPPKSGKTTPIEE